jgi:HEAT repeat protein
MASFLHNGRLRLITPAVVLALAISATICLWSHTRPSEPSYKGRRLSEWVALYGNYPGFKYSDFRQEPAEAIQHIGTNALPSLVAWIAYEPSPWTKRLQTVFDELSPLIAESAPARKLFPFNDAYVRALNATAALRLLGPLAAPAVPELARRISLTNSPDARLSAIAALSCIGPPAAPIMASVLSNHLDAKSAWVMSCIEDMGTNARPLLPILVRNLQHQDIGVVASAEYALGALKLDPTLVVPALTDCLRDPRRDARWAATYALMKFGALARDSLPALTNALRDPDRDVRNIAATAIEAIAPKATSDASPE